MSDEEPRYEFFGDTVSLAMSMERSSGSGKIQVTESTKALAENELLLRKAAYELRGQHPVRKGSAELINVYFVRNAADAPDTASEAQPSKSSWAAAAAFGTLSDGPPASTTAANITPEIYWPPQPVANSTSRAAPDARSPEPTDSRHTTGPAYLAHDWSGPADACLPRSDSAETAVAS
eukprot:TRINITY_DN7327_c0_g3_i1.p1 TRINITY_DN7327_c0_g3~~TRINITY_DN7327_c0_g3_i1.p1  ORF type:complete len:178 (-),score=25.83 TRINITY_DN7327_c0_g3_i1:197-730(-)